MESTEVLHCRNSESASIGCTFVATFVLHKAFYYLFNSLPQQFPYCLQILVDISTSAKVLEALTEAVGKHIAEHASEFSSSKSVNLGDCVAPLKITLSVGFEYSHNGVSSFPSLLPVFATKILIQGFCRMDCWWRHARDLRFYKRMKDLVNSLPQAANYEEESFPIFKLTL